MNRWHGNTGRVERVGEAYAARAAGSGAANPIPPPLRGAPLSQRGAGRGAPPQPRLETEDLLLGLILNLLVALKGVITGKQRLTAASLFVCVCIILTQIYILL